MDTEKNAQVAPVRRRRVVILGATGSIGTNALRVIRAHADRLELVGVAARSDRAALARIAREHGVRHVALHDAEAARLAREEGLFSAGTQVLDGPGGLCALATLPEADIVLVAVVGTAGLGPALAAIEAGKDLALASKEILVMAGRFVMEAARRKGVRLLPVDSEHNAVFQCLEGHSTRAVRRVILTASGGAFRDWPIERLRHATPADALKHPNWSMGPKVTVDSATLANKGLELIEAQCLFGLEAGQCSAVLHPQSLVHSLVEFTDGSMLAQLCPSSMTFPIQHALLYPYRPAGVDKPIDFLDALRLDFRPVDEARFPMLGHARAAMLSGGVAPAVFNAANEVAVAAFLGGKIPFLAIPSVVGQSLARSANFEPSSLASVLEADAQARIVALEEVAAIK